MTKELKRPTWYQDGFYSKSRSVEDWLYEFCKRDEYRRNDVGYTNTIRMLPKEEQEIYFINLIFNQQQDKLLNMLKAIPPQPIKYLPVSDVFRMYHLIINTAWYKNHPNRLAFENAILKITHNGILTRKQKEAFMEMLDTPWCAFNENHQQNSWYPNKDIDFLSGIPLSLAPGYSKKDTTKVLNKKLSGWVGKLQDIRLQFETWQESKILAVFDLMCWFKIQQIEYTNIGLYKIIWPQGRISKSTGMEVNPYDGIDHSIKLVSRVISTSVIKSLFNLCEARKHQTQTNEA
jgi:hypothetical protein